jgi:hypothetical protein
MTGGSNVNAAGGTGIAWLLGDVSLQVRGTVRVMGPMRQETERAGLRLRGNSRAVRVAGSSRQRSARVAGSSRQRSALWLGALAWAVLAACSAEPPRGNLQNIEPETYRVENPSADRALATGVGCASTENEAEQRAREVSTFNLRRVTGNARYRIEFSRVRETSEPNRVCVELQAQAIPPRFR